MKALVGAFNLVGAFSVIVQPVVEPMEHYTALLISEQGGAIFYKSSKKNLGLVSFEINVQVPSSKVKF